MGDSIPQLPKTEMLAFAPVSVSEFKTNELIPAARSRHPHPPELSDGESSTSPQSQAGGFVRS